MRYYQIKKRFRISAAHRFYSGIKMGRGLPLTEMESNEVYLKDFPDENQIHGHTFFIEIVLESKKLDEQGSVINTNKLKGSINKCIAKYDHCFFIAKDDPLLPSILDILKKNKFKILVIGKEPTGEVLAEDIFNFFDNEFKNIFPKEEYPDEFKLVRVDINIGDSTGISYGEV